MHLYITSISYTEYTDVFFQDFFYLFQNDGKVHLAHSKVIQNNSEINQMEGCFFF